MSDLVEFLRARLDEDEAKARATAWSMATSIDNSWNVRRKGTRDDPEWSIYATDRFELVSGLREDDAEHIARHDPARVLAEVAAKRTVVARAETTIEMAAENPESNILKGSAGAYEATLKILALPYADHPDYRDEWRP